MLIELVRRAAADAPEQPFVISSAGSLTYSECVSRAESLAAGLAARRVARFGIALEDAGAITALLVASSVAGSEACVYPRGLAPAELSRLAGRFDHDLVVTDREIALDAAKTMRLSDLADADPRGPAPHSSSAPVLILTTGTTGEPKGARHDWGRLAAAVRRPDEEPGARWLLAYNLNQFGGTQVLLHALVSGATLVAPPSSEARDVIETMRRERVTHVSATPTFWRILVGGLDTSAARALPLRQVTLGGEPVPGPLIDKLRQLFPAAQISQIYGATETGTAISVRDGRGGLPLSVLERDDDADVRLRIVDGELQISSRIGMLGYHEGEPAQEWRRTGDMVEVRDDRIHFVGRSNEIINVGGVKVHPLPIEDLVCGVTGVALAAAYGQANPITGHIVALDVVTVAGADPDEVKAAIRAATEVLPRASRPGRIRFVDALETRGSKVVRRESAT